MMAASASNPPTTDPAIMPARAPEDRPPLLEPDPALSEFKLAEVIVEGGSVDVKVEVPTTTTIDMRSSAVCVDRDGRAKAPIGARGLGGDPR
jgi:hypothetical protein